MPEPEQRAFEEHFFECEQCASDVEAGMALRANAAAIFSGEPRPELRQAPLWSAWKWPALVFAAMLIVVIGFYELLRVPGQRIQPVQAYPAFFLHPVARGADQVVEPSEGAKMLGLWFDVPPGAQHPAYECRLLDASGRTRWTVTAPSPRAPGDPLHLLMPAAAAPPGDYTLLLTAGGREISRFQFTLKKK